MLTICKQRTRARWPPVGMGRIGWPVCTIQEPCLGGIGFIRELCGLPTVAQIWCWDVILQLAKMLLRTSWNYFLVELYCCPTDLNERMRRFLKSVETLCQLVMCNGLIYLLSDLSPHAQCHVAHLSLHIHMYTCSLVGQVLETWTLTMLKVFCNLS